VSLTVDEPGEAERVFKALSEGGQVTMPIDETAWALRFGMLTDRFGAKWMVNCNRPAAGNNA
jgi:PhnB protein